MTPLRSDEVISGETTQPDMERHRRVFHVFTQPAIRLDEHVLDYIAGVHPLSDSFIKPIVKHASDRTSVAFKEVVYCL